MGSSSTTKRFEYLEDLKDVKILLEYLYADSSRYVDVSNGLCVLRLSMNDEMQLLDRNMNFPDCPPSRREIDLLELIAVIEQLKENPSSRVTGVTAWDEIVASAILIK